MGGLNLCDPNALSVTLWGDSPTGSEEGVCASSDGDLNADAQDHNSESRGKWFGWKEGSSYKWGGRIKAQEIMGLNHNVSAGYRSKFDLTMSKCWTIGSFSTQIFGAKYLNIRPTWNETVGGPRTDLQTAAGRKYVKSGGTWTNTVAKARKEKERELKELNKVLTERAGAKLEETINSMTQKIKECNERSNEMNMKIVSSIRVKAEKIHWRGYIFENTIKNLQSTVKKLEQKTSQFEEVCNAASKLHCKKGYKEANMLNIKASVNEFMSSCIKLGE